MSDYKGSATWRKCATCGRVRFTPVQPCSKLIERSGGRCLGVLIELDQDAAEAAYKFGGYLAVQEMVSWPSS